MDRTITVLTLDLPPELAERLRLASEERGAMPLRDIALEALEEWLERREGPEAGSGAARTDRK